MKDKWKFCQCCYLNGHCENQDRGHKCETYPKQLEDKVERLQEQLKEANEIILKLGKWTYVASDGEPIRISKYIKKWGVK